MTHPLFINHWAWLNLAWVHQWLIPGTCFSIRLSLNVLPFCTSLPNPNILQNFKPFQAKCWKMIKNTFKILRCELSSGQKLQQIDISGKKLFYGNVIGRRENSRENELEFLDYIPYRVQITPQKRAYSY